MYESALQLLIAERDDLDSNICEAKRDVENKGEILRNLHNYIINAQKSLLSIENAIKFLESAESKE